MVSLNLTLVFAVACCHANVAFGFTDRPIIGILTEPLGTETGGAAGNFATQSYIALSNVKWVEQGGARVVPIHYDAPDESLREIVGKINGLYFPGGGTSLTEATCKGAPACTRYRQAAQVLYTAALEASTGGEIFPVHGTCMGFQLIALLVARTDNILCSACYNSVGDPLPLDYQPNPAAAKKSALFRHMSSDLYDALGTEKLTENSHGDGIFPETFQSNENLRTNFTVLSTNVDYAGRAFVSTFESTDPSLSITAVQWHPEKNNFEWGGVGAMGETAIPHSIHAVEISQYISNNFVATSRLNSHHFASKEDLSANLLKFDHGPVADPNGYFEGVYMWNLPADIWNHSQPSSLLGFSEGLFPIPVAPLLLLSIVTVCGLTYSSARSRSACTTHEAYQGLA